MIIPGTMGEKLRIQLISNISTFKDGIPKKNKILARMFSFEGNFKTKKVISLGGSKGDSDRLALLEKTHQERRERQENRIRLDAVRLITKAYKRFLDAKTFKEYLYNEWKVLVAEIADKDQFNPDLLIKSLRLFLFSFSSGKRDQLEIQYRISAQHLRGNYVPFYLRAKFTFICFSQISAFKPQDLGLMKEVHEILLYLLSENASPNIKNMIVGLLIRGRLIKSFMQVPCSSQSLFSLCGHLYQSCPDGLRDDLLKAVIPEVLVGNGSLIQHDSDLEHLGILLENQDIIYWILLNRLSHEEQVIAGVNLAKILVKTRKESEMLSLLKLLETIVASVANKINGINMESSSSDSEDEPLSSDIGLEFDTFLKSLFTPAIVKRLLEAFSKREDQVNFDSIVAVSRLLSTIRLVNKRKFHDLIGNFQTVTVIDSFWLVLRSLYDSSNGDISNKDLKSIVLSTSAIYLRFFHVMTASDFNTLHSSAISFMELEKLVIILKTLVFSNLRFGFWPKSDNDVLIELLSLIHSKNRRYQVLDELLWIVEGGVTEHELLSMSANEYYMEEDAGLVIKVLHQTPYFIPFINRVKFFGKIMREICERNFDFQPGIVYRIRRNHVFQDAYSQMNGTSVNWAKRIRISFVDEFGMEEAGIDGGGVFKEFLNRILKEALNPNYGLFQTSSDGLIYPSTTTLSYEETSLGHFKFLGKIIGKALMERVLIDVNFATFFLAKLIGQSSQIDDLMSLDAELYRNILFLKSFGGNVEELGLNFTVSLNEFGVQSERELIANGKETPVTETNRLTYIFLVANDRLNNSIRYQTKAFSSGLYEVVKKEILQIFNENELQLLLSGATDVIDLSDWKVNTVYGNGFASDHPTIVLFWQVVDSFSNQQKQRLLKFCTSCSRPPFLGFSELNPKFCISMAGSAEDRLPSSSTCINLLKMPAYNTFDKLKEKLIYSISSEAGFYLS